MALKKCHRCSANINLRLLYCIEEQIAFDWRFAYQSFIGVLDGRGVTVSNSAQNRKDERRRGSLANRVLSEKFGEAQGRFLAALQRMEIRGLKTRWEKLSSSYAVDSVALVEKLTAFQEDYRARAVSQSSSHKDQSHRLITEWDEVLDEALRRSELATLEKIQWERATLKTLKNKRKDAESKQRTDYERLRERMESDFQSRRAQVKQVRDQALSKLGGESTALDESMGEIREWVSVKTANSALSQKEHEATEPPKTWDHIPTLAAMAKEYETQRKRLSEKQMNLQSNSLARVVSPLFLFVIALVAGGIAFGVTNAIESPPLILVIASLLSAILVPAIVYLSTLPLIGKSLREGFHAVLEEEQSLRGLLLRGRAIAENNFRNELARLEGQYQETRDQAERTHEALLRQMEEDYRANKQSTIESTVREKSRFRAERLESFAKVNESFPGKVELLSAKQRSEVDGLRAEAQDGIASLNARFRDAQRALTKRWKSGVGFVQEHMRWVDKQRGLRFPEWYSPQFDREDWVRDDSSLALPLGEFRIHVSPGESHPAKSRPADWEQLKSLAGRISEGTSFPFLYDLIGHGGLIFQSDNPESREAAQMSMRNLLLRAVTALPAGSLHVTVIDPEGLGKQYSWLMHLADIAPELVNHRVWTQPIHIADQLALTARHIEDVIQQSLRNQYRNLYEYNQQAGPMAIPYRLIVWSGFPFGLDDSSWQSLCSILSSGNRCGVGVLLDWSTSIQWPTFADRDKLREFALHGIVHASKVVSSPVDDQVQKLPARLHLNLPEFEGVPVDLEMPPDEGAVARIMEKHLVAATNIGKRIVPYESLKKGAELEQSQSSSHGLEIPIGISDAGRVQFLSLGEGTSQHVLIAGKTGSGKSSLLHTLISSAAMEYSPDELRLVLLDFKKGVEFQVYSELQLAHTDIIGIESRREFGLSTLEYLDKVLSARGEAFRTWGVQDLPSLKRKHPEIKLPRILIVIDEFQEMFVEDDKLSQQASMLMDRIVRQGRSFGMHLVLASQTLGGAYSLPRTTLAQMAVRIALQCDSADAMLILGEDNTAAERLRYSGQGIYNAGGGRLEANQNFQVAYLPKHEQVDRLRLLPSQPVPHSPLTNAIGRRVVFEGHKLALWDATVVGQLAPNTTWVLGESVSIEPAVQRSFARAPGRNAMVVSNQEDLVASVVGSWIATETMRVSGDSKFWLLDGSRAEEPSLQSLVQACKSQKNCKVTTLREIEQTMQSLGEELLRRSAEPDGDYSTLVVVVLNLGRFRELRREEDFSFGGNTDGGVKPDAVLAKLLADGPGLGIHVCLCADSASTLSRWLSRGSLRDIELRILGQMSGNDSNQLIDNNQANRLDRHVMLVHDDSDGRSVKFRPFTIDSVVASINGGAK